MRTLTVVCGVVVCRSGGGVHRHPPPLSVRRHSFKLVWTCEEGEFSNFRHCGQPTVNSRIPVLRAFFTVVIFAAFPEFRLQNVDQFASHATPIYFAKKGTIYIYIYIMGFRRGRGYPRADISEGVFAVFPGVNKYIG